MERLERLLANKGKLTPFVGTGATAAAVPGNPIASWDGLLEDGIRACVRFGAPSEWAELTLARLRSGDVITYLAVADEISRRLDEFGEWGQWLEQTIGKIKFTGRSPLHVAICKLNRIVLTTNYDLLLESASPRHKTVSCDEPDRMREVIGEDETLKAVVHLHGVWDRPKSVVLGSWQYQALIDRGASQFWQRVLLARRLVFIGCGSGLRDPNIGPALRFVKDLSSAGSGDSSLHEHYILVRGADLAGALNDFRDLNVVPIAYGLEHSDLAQFLAELTAGGRPSASQDARSYLEPRRTPDNMGLLDLAGPAEDAVQAALSAVRRALQAIGQVERRSALPLGVDGWGLADQLVVHERTAASVMAPVERLHTEVTALTVAVQSADPPMAWLTGQHNPRLTTLFALVEELIALCEELGLRIKDRITELEERSALTGRYNPTIEALRNVRKLADDITASASTLPTT